MVTGLPVRGARAAAWAPGTWGELVQGTVGGEDVLITCPVNLYTLAVAVAPAGSGPSGPAGTVAATGWQSPAARSQTAVALAQLPGAGRVRLRSRLRPGAGMGSSTADLCAALVAAAALAGTTLSPDELFRRCLQLEPTDGLMFPGIALVDHRGGGRVELLGPPPPLAILGVDPGGTVRTGDFNRRADLAAANRRKEPAVRAALDMAQAAVAAGDPAMLAAAATLSARAHQPVLANPLWETAQTLAPRCGALGLNVAHSGTVLGFLLDARRTDLPAMRTWLQQRLGLPVWRLSLVGGGVTVGTCDGR